MDAFFLKVDVRLNAMTETTGQQMASLSDVVTKGLSSVTDKIDAHVVATDAKIADLQQQITAIISGSSTPPSYAAASSASAGPAFHPAASAPRPTTTGPDEACLVFIRGFPVTQPGIVLREYAAEALDILPPRERMNVKVRASAADTQFSLVFATPTLASTFVENYRAHAFVYTDDDKATTPLTCRTGKPLALRRRGGLIMPVYAQLEIVLKRTRTLTTASISQVSKPRGGIMHTEFFALVGKTLTPLFTLRFKDEPDGMSIETFTPSVVKGPISDADLELLEATAVQK